jgi:hypothetical protein
MSEPDDRVVLDLRLHLPDVGDGAVELSVTYDPASSQPLLLVMFAETGGEGESITTVLPLVQLRRLHGFLSLLMMDEQGRIP